MLFTSCAEVKNEWRHILIPMCAFMACEGYDKISNKIPKLCASYLGQPLTYIHNTSITPRNFPVGLKCSVVVPVFKNGDVTNSQLFANLFNNRFLQSLQNINL